MSPCSSSRAISQNSLRLSISLTRDFQVSSLSLVCFMEANILPALAESFQKSGSEERLSFSLIEASRASESKTPPDIHYFPPELVNGLG